MQCAAGAICGGTGAFGSLACVPDARTRSHAECPAPVRALQTFIMDLTRAARSSQLDALNVRGVAAFAAFACTKKLANLQKRPVATAHWDKRIPHVGFYAMRDIEPFEELSYLRKDEEPKRSSEKNCGWCAAPPTREAGKKG